MNVNPKTSRPDSANPSTFFERIDPKPGPSIMSIETGSINEYYSLAQSQEEFYFSLPLDKMDLCLYGADHAVPPEDLARVAGMTGEQVLRAYEMIAAKRKSARYLKSAAMIEG